jgi:hypothetical protein
VSLRVPPSLQAAWLVSTLVKAGADVNAMCGAALREAAGKGDERIVEQVGHLMRSSEIRFDMITGSLHT